MIPMYQQQQQQPTAFPNGFQFGYQQPPHNQFGYQQQQQQSFGLGPSMMPMNWQQQNNWAGGPVNGQSMPL